MALQDVDIKAFTFIANNPKLRKEMLDGLAREGYKDHPAITAQEDIENRIKERLDPVLEENKELRKRLDERERSEIWNKQRESVRQGPFRFNDEKLKKLEERMASKDAPQFPEVDSQGRTAYQNAALYFQNQDSPVAASTFPQLDFTGAPRGTESWRELLQESDKSKNPMYMNKRERRKLGDRLWEEAKAEEMAKLQNR